MALAHKRTLAEDLVMRMSFFQKIIEYARSLLPRKEKWLLNFNDFSFYLESGQTLVGGNQVKVWYHPGEEYREELTPVLSLWWQAAIETGTLDSFDKDVVWQRVILRLIKHRTGLQNPA